MASRFYRTLLLNCTTLVMVGLPLTLLSNLCCAQTAAESTVEAQIRFYSQRISDHPRSYNAHAQLAAAYLARARQINEPALLNKARTALRRSVEIQPNLSAFKTMTALCNFAHRFDDALRWAKRAALAAPADTSVTAHMVESYLGLGRDTDASELLPPPGVKPADYYTTIAHGRWLVSKGRIDDAVGAFRRAAELAWTQEAIELSVWAWVSAAGVLLDSQHTQEAELFLQFAFTLRPTNARAWLHRAELLEAQGEYAKALSVYEKLLSGSDDPSIHAKAFATAQQLGQDQRARYHFESAEAGFRKVIESGEVYTLGSLARLYDAASIHLERGVQLAGENLLYNRDAKAWATFESVKANYRIASKH